LLENEGSVQHLGGRDEYEKDSFKTVFELDQRWIIEHAAGRSVYICQARSFFDGAEKHIAKTETKIGF